MQARIVRREIARLAHHLLSLRVFAVANQNPRANRASIAFGSFEANLDPVIGCRRIVA
jgi:hypothetical protein